MDLGWLNLAEAVSNDVDGKGSVDDAHAHVAFPRRHRSWH
jgi:hypothetical protein